MNPDRIVVENGRNLEQSDATSEVARKHLASVVVVGRLLPQHHGLQVTGNSQGSALAVGNIVAASLGNYSAARSTTGGTSPLSLGCTVVGGNPCMGLTVAIAEMIVVA
jgi:hypothetical protein